MHYKVNKRAYVLDCAQRLSVCGLKFPDLLLVIFSNPEEKLELGISRNRFAEWDWNSTPNQLNKFM
jgi:hypothetical protein